MKLILGQRVCRSINLDNGEWQIKGDKCLPGPQMYGHIEKVYQESSEYGIYNLIDVRFDDGNLKTFLSHGVTVI